MVSKPGLWRTDDGAVVFGCSPGRINVFEERDWHPHRIECPDGSTFGPLHKPGGQVSDVDNSCRQLGRIRHEHCAFFAGRMSESPRPVTASPTQVTRSANEPSTRNHRPAASEAREDCVLARDFRSAIVLHRGHHIRVKRVQSERVLVLANLLLGGVSVAAGHENIPLYHLFKVPDRASYVTRLPGNVDHGVPVLGGNGCERFVAVAVSTYQYRANGDVNPASEARHLMPGGEGGRGDSMADPGRPSKYEKFHGSSMAANQSARAQFRHEQIGDHFFHKVNVETLPNRGGVASPQKGSTAAPHWEPSTGHSDFEPFADSRRSKADFD
jgi:hypothetical protein